MSAHDRTHAVHFEFARSQSHVAAHAVRRLAFAPTPRSLTAHLFTKQPNSPTHERPHPPHAYFCSHRG
eukprot:10998727-Alexandrium_andersonii.AAC.1